MFIAVLFQSGTGSDKRYDQIGSRLPDAQLHGLFLQASSAIQATFKPEVPAPSTA